MPEAENSIVSGSDDVFVQPPWPIDGNIDEERTCSRCGEMIPPKWRHFWPICSCTYRPTYKLPDPDCPACEGTGFLPCQPQDLSTLRRWGKCEACGAVATELFNESGAVPGSARHRYIDATDHEIVVVSDSLTRVLGDYLDSQVEA